MIECEYTTTVNGKELSIYYSGGFTWSAWLQEVGQIACSFYLEECASEVSARIGHHLNLNAMAFHDYPTRGKDRNAAVPIHTQ